jgi:Ca2+-binding EF-hand superfamily protein
MSTADHLWTWPEILEKLQTFVYKRRIRLENFFLGFDVRRCGQITRQKFHSVVGQTDLPLTALQIDICLERFAVPGTDDMRNYREFCRQINEISGTKDLNRTPLDGGMAHSAALPDPSNTIQPLSDRDEEQLKKLLGRMKVQVVARRMNIREQFKDYDKKPRKSYITKQQFKQSIARLGLATEPAEFDILCKKYRCTDLDDMNYQAFCQDIDPQ